MAGATGVDCDYIWKVLIPVSVFGWLIFGIICILCLNGQGRAGRWVPEWYLDSDRTRRDKLSVVLWWFAVLVMWPVILPLMGMRHVIQHVKTRAERRHRKRQLLAHEHKCEEGYGHRSSG
ncbi:hypothetical protein JDV02_008618 [Purpureocillium takamizusanense]|uniref:Uncharacterized protein n=1 Tax=Purpureocillium takamizusanense TaxID=2060973 RepID=A0A9Q8VFG4_9HYPO|nr:uncharacterized protein JDV02_008618 [Purpureocillium takamizusanense]UNI22757.1 hypothetical protein JDV02_008618 [Purpureocillium takamizusanense]